MSEERAAVDQASRIGLVTAIGLHLQKALMPFDEEGAAQVIPPDDRLGPIVGAVGASQFDVLASRIEQENGQPARLEWCGITRS